MLKIVEDLWAVGAPPRTPLGSSQRSPEMGGVTGRCVGYNVPPPFLEPVGYRGAVPDWVKHFNEIIFSAVS